MVSLDYSIIPAIIIFLALVFALNYLLFQPILKTQDERASRTTGLMAQSRRKLENRQDLFRTYEERIKGARVEGYRLQEHQRGAAMRKRAAMLEEARKSAEQMTEESRASIQSAVRAAKEQVAAEAQEIARGIAARILQRPV